MDERRLRMAANEALFREVNERIEGLNDAFGSVTGDFEIVCECADENCMERIYLSPAAYEAVRSDPTHFAIIRGHVAPSCEFVLERRETYDVVEKVDEAAVVAEQLDPRN